MYKFILITINTLALVFLVSCAGMPKTSNDLIKDTKNIKTYCYSKQYGQVERKLISYLSEKYKTSETIIYAGGAYIPVTTKYLLLNEKINNGNKISLKGNSTYSYAAILQRGSSRKCKTKVTMYAITGFWKRIFEKINLAILSE